MKLSQLYSEHIYLTNSHTAKRSKRWLIGSWICLSDLRKVAEKLHSSNCDDSTQKQDKSHERSPCSPHALTTARPYTADLLLVEVVKMHIFLSSLTALSAYSFFVYIYKELDQNALLVYRSHSFYLEIMIQKKKKKKTSPRECYLISPTVCCLFFCKVGLCNCNEALERTMWWLCERCVGKWCAFYTTELIVFKPIRLIIC